MASFLILPSKSINQFKLTDDQINSIKAVDVHGHYGACNRPAMPDFYNRALTGDAARVAERARRAGIEWTVVSPLSALFPRGQAHAPTGNDDAAAIVPQTPGLRQWVVINPLQPETYRQAETMLAQPWCVGIKIHPEEHLYPIREHGRAIFEFAARHRAVVLTHSGEGNSLPLDFVPFADDFPAVTLILAHLSFGPNSDVTHQVRAIQKGRQGNIYTDTSSSMSMISGVIEWAVGEIGPEKVLFGTDTPLYSAAAQRHRIDLAEIPAAARKMILSDNARRILTLN